MRVKISGGQRLDGTIRLPGSKAYTHRALVAGLLSSGESKIRNPSSCDDTNYTISAIEKLGATLSRREDELIVSGTTSPHASQTIECGESGATLRFLAAIGTICDSPVALNRNDGLTHRPLGPLADALRTLGARISVNGPIVTIQGPLTGGLASITGEVSSQFVSALLFASPRAKNNVTIKLEGRLESRPYVEMTLDVLKQHGVKVERIPDGYRVPAPQEYHPAEHDVPRDFSSAAFMMTSVATAGGNATFSGIGTRNDHLEPDQLVVDLLRKIGINVKETSRTISISSGDQFDSFEFDARDNPDLVSSLEVLACFAKGSSRITGTGRLRYKESNRLTSVPSELEKMGADIHVQDEVVNITGPQRLKGALVSSHNDHRVVMACSAAALGAQGISTIDGAGAVSKSYPQFFEDLSKLGVGMSVE